MGCCWRIGHGFMINAGALSIFMLDRPYIIRDERVKSYCAWNSRSWINRKICGSYQCSNICFSGCKKSRAKCIVVVVLDAPEDIVGITPRCSSMAESQVKGKDGTNIAKKLHNEFKNWILSESTIIPCDKIWVRGKNETLTGGYEAFSTFNKAQSDYFSTTLS